LPTSLIGKCALLQLFFVTILWISSCYYFVSQRWKTKYVAKKLWHIIKWECEICRHHAGTLTCNLKTHAQKLLLLRVFSCYINQKMHLVLTILLSWFYFLLLYLPSFTKCYVYVKFLVCENLFMDNLELCNQNIKIYETKMRVTPKNPSTKVYFYFWVKSFSLWNMRVSQNLRCYLSKGYHKLQSRSESLTQRPRSAACQTSLRTCKIGLWNLDQFSYDVDYLRLLQYLHIVLKWILAKYFKHSEFALY